METSKPVDPKNVFVEFALMGSLGLFAFYYILLFLVTKDPMHPFTQFGEFQPWMSILIVGFGAQVGLYFLLKKGFRLTISQKQDTNVAAGTGTAASGLSMVACCAHHVVDVLPILGVTGAALFLTEYQKELLIVGIVANLAGIIYMVWLVAGKNSPKAIMQFVTSNRKEMSV